MYLDMLKNKTMLTKFNNILSCCLAKKKHSNSFYENKFNIKMMTIQFYFNNML